MSVLQIESATVALGGRPVVEGVSFALEQGEIGCLLGPSGCGKTTLLRAIAGLQKLASGSISLNGSIVDDGVNHTPPQKRGIGMVFQDFALFPHLDVRGNIGFGIGHLPRKARDARIAAMLALTDLVSLAQRYPHELSGGQQQRLALARAMAAQPVVLLLDEPFSALDASLRESLAQEVRSLIRAAGMTALLVTHDQHEAFAMADRIGVMHAGQLQQWGSAEALYQQPANTFVASFIGAGSLLPATQTAAGWQCELGSVAASQIIEGQALLRPDDVCLQPDGIAARIQRRSYRGTHCLYQLALPSGAQVVSELSGELALPEGAWVELGCGMVVHGAKMVACIN